MHSCWCIYLWFKSLCYIQNDVGYKGLFKQMWKMSKCKPFYGKTSWAYRATLGNLLSFLGNNFVKCPKSYLSSKKCPYLSQHGKKMTKVKALGLIQFKKFESKVPSLFSFLAILTKILLFCKRWISLLHQISIETNVQIMADITV